MAIINKSGNSPVSIMRYLADILIRTTIDESFANGLGRSGLNDLLSGRMFTC